MKHFILSLALLTTFSFSSIAERVLEGAEAQKDIPGAETVRYKDQLSIPAFIKFREGRRIPASKWQDWMTSRYFKDAENIGFTLVGEETDRLGMIHYRYKQTANGFPITFGTWIVHTLNGEVVSMNGVLFEEVASSNAALTESQALDHALNFVGASSYKWDIPLEEEAIKIMMDDPNATYFPEGELEIVNEDITLKEINLRAAWKFNIYAHEPMSRQEVFVDAQNGDILFTNDLIHHADSNITAVTGYSGNQTITADWTGSQFRLRETGRGDGVRTFDLNNGTSGLGVDFFHPDSLWDVTTVSQYATDAHWGAEMTYDFFFNHFNRNSIDNNGFALISRVHYGSNFGNAFWNGQVMTYGDGSNGNSPFTAVDIAGHEIAHGLTTFTANLVYAYEPGALNESFSDIFGAAVEFDGLGFANGDWTMGEDLGFIIRYMNNPNLGSDPDCYEGSFWYTGTGDNGGVHINSGVQNFWFYLLVEGGSGTNDNGDAYSVTGLGLDDASAIAYRNLVTYLTETSQYEDARYYGIQSAIDLFGPCSQETESTWRAWHAVGLGDAWTGEVVADFEADLPIQCESPATVNFTNLSTLATTYSWDFGDGNTSTAFNPTNVYANDGEYTVSLIASSSCGADSVVYTEVIKVGPNYPCNVTLPPGGGFAQTQTSCEGILYDDGGPAGNYSANYNSTIVISPTNAQAVTLEFIQFDVEEDPSCQYDYLTIYDGAGTGSPILGTYCNSVAPPTFLSSTTGSITLQFSTDQGLEEAGFEIGWECSIPSEAPVADFTSDLQETCKGDIAFTDLSALGNNIPTSWYWEFGDGDTSNLKNPEHSYATSGEYTVMLVASNAFGSDTATKVEYISVDRPDEPIGDDVEVCPGNQAQLIASGPGEHLWYDAPTGGNVIHVGDTFVTPIVQQSTPFYVEAEIAGPSQSTGAPDNMIGSGTYFTFFQSIYFNVISPFRLHSVTVYASLPGDREIIVLNQFSQIVMDTTIYVETGEQELILDWDMEVGNDYQMTLADGSMVNLWRNNGGVNYPYEIEDVVSIYKSSAQTDPYSYYYFFYNWQVQDICVSDRAMISASVGECTGIDELDRSSYSVFPNPSNGNVRVGWEQTNNPGTISVYNAAGALVRQFQVSDQNAGVDLDLSALDRGIYLLRGSQGERPLSRRIVLQ